MNIFVMGMNHTTAPVEIREKYSYKEEELHETLKALKNVEGVLECAILSTCNRVELHALMLSDDHKEILNFLLKKGNLKESDGDKIQRHIYTYRNGEDIEHLCRV